jgi:excinuclease ABC subunit C
MKAKGGQVLYVGKAKLLPKRVPSYFQRNLPSARIDLMVRQVADFDFVVTGTEKEALLLENSLIKKHRPKYNVMLTDDKTYPSLRLSVSEPFPRLEVVRRPRRDGSLIYGPFPSPGALRETLRIVNRLFPLRRCHREDVKRIDRPCLNFQMGMCMGPCRPGVTPEEYRRLTDEVRLFFQGKRQDLKRGLESEMRARSKALDFEAAAVLRDRLYDLEKTLERQIVTTFDEKDLDVWAIAQSQGLFCGAVLCVRQGAVTGCQPIFASGSALSEDLDGEAQALASLMGQYYTPKTQVPAEILVPALPPGEDLAILGSFLGGMAGRAVRITAPRKGDRLKLLGLAKENATAILDERLERMTKTHGAMAELQKRLQLERIPRRVECFDLAHLQGEAAVAGMVVLEDGELRKSQYRKFRIKEAKGGDDYEGMREVIRRRFSPDKDKDKWPEPDLLLLDGGRGQISSALAAFADLGLKPPPLVGIAKDRGDGGPDRIFLPGRKNPADLKPGSAGILILAKLRDEAHRFCRGYHHGLMSKGMLESALSGIKGLGPKRGKALSLGFPSLESLAKATDEEILRVARLPKDSLQRLREGVGALLAQRDGEG